MKELEIMPVSYRPLADIWADFDKPDSFVESIEERRNIMDPFVRDRILYLLSSFRKNPRDAVDSILGDLQDELRSCSGLYSDLELRRLIGQETTYAIEEWAKPANESFRIGSRRAFMDRYFDENEAPDLINSNITKLMETVRGWRGYPAIGFRIPLFDNTFGGIYPGDICVLAGTPGSMKTSLAINAVDDVIERSDQFVCYYSLDMPPEVIVERLIMRECGLSERDLRLQLADRMPKAIEAREIVRERYEGRLAIKGHLVQSNMTVSSMLHDAAARIPGLVVIDYLTRLKPEGITDLQFVEPAMNSIHRFAAVYRIPFLILSQMSRASRDAQASGRIGGHSRGGGIVEELAYTEIELQKHYTPEDAPLEGDRDPIIATITKARHGLSGRSFFLEKDGPTMRFTGKAVLVKRPSSKREKPAFEAVKGYFNQLA